MHQNLQDAGKAECRRKFVTFKYYVRKKEQSRDLTSYFRNIE